MIHALTDTQQHWVDKTLRQLSLEQAVGQLLNVSSFHDDREYWLPFMERVPFGAMTGRSNSAEEYRNFLTEMQQHAAIPLFVLANMEHGAAEIQGYGTDFPWAMAVAAANDDTLAATMGEAVATEARHLGINWLLNPNIDLNYNANNPITNIRSMGDNPVRVSRLATIYLKAMQAHGVAATAKHFPGDGVDDRDQHLVTTINTLPFDQWLETFGQVWKAVIEADVMTIMPGHISLPDYQGYQANPEAAPPATISRKLLIDLLRQELGYTGLIVSDSTTMIGLATWGDPDDMIVRTIESGIDVYLNANHDHDFDRLLKSVHDGRITEDRIYESARRVLEVKARLNLFEDAFGSPASPDEQARFQAAAQQIADKSITILRSDESVPVATSDAKTALTVTIGQLNPRFGLTDLDTFDDALRSRGYEVEHLLNPASDELREKADSADIVFINIYKDPIMPLGSTRMTDTFRTWGWRSLYKTHPNVAYTAFGNPYVIYELPPVTRLIATYGASDCSQEAAVKVLLGEIDATGALPIRLPRVEIKRLDI